MNNVEEKLKDKNPNISPAIGFVDSVMLALPDKPNESSRVKSIFRLFGLPLSTILAGSATFAVLAFFVLPSVRHSGAPKNPDAARDAATQTITELGQIEQTNLESKNIEQEIVTIETDVDKLDDEITVLENDLSDESLGLN